MNIETLDKIKSLSADALKGRKRLSNLHDSYINALNNGSITRARTTTYNARTAEIMEWVKPAELELKEILTCQ